MNGRALRGLVGLAVIGVIAVSLGGCSETKKALGLSKRAPDEFAVYSRAPLSLPPDYGLRPPTPGADRPQETSTRNEARAAVTGRRTPESALSGDYSQGTQAFLLQAGVAKAEPDIRALVNKETTFLAENDKSLTEAVLFWQTPNEYGVAVDPEKENQRLRENMALGKPVNDGEVPVIGKKRQGLLEGIF